MERPTDYPAGDRRPARRDHPLAGAPGTVHAPAGVVQWMSTVIDEGVVVMRPNRHLTARRPAVAAALAALVVPLVAMPAAGAQEQPVRAAGTAAVAAAPLATAVDSTITFTGHGWGHGRGMGQYGALGYAVDHGANYRDILAHYYGGTTVGDVGNPSIDVELVARSQSNWALVAGNGLRANGNDIPGAGLDVVQVVRSGSTYTLLRGSGCEATSWTNVGTYPTSVEFTVPTQSGYENLVRTCETGNKMRAYRGSIVTTAYGTSTTRMLVANRVTLENYLIGVVPRESPASWGDLGGRRGMQALKAQAVAARSYAYASGPRSSGARTCDTTACQVYGGAAELSWNGSAYVLAKILDATNTNVAVAETSGEVRLLPGGAVARTEFSSSTGGYTTGGTFPAIVDEGDDISINPNHTWTAEVSASSLASKLGVPGPLRNLEVTARNGNGEWGGRVTQIRYVDANGTARTLGNPADPVRSGEQIRTALGLKSDWFRISWVPTGEAEQVVRALYQDVLGRSVDASGLRTWTEYITRTRDTAGLVRGIASSHERMQKLVAVQYQTALGRNPEPSGLAFWVDYLKAGRGVYDLQVGIYSSAEAFQKLGGGDLQAWVGGLYEKILGRTAGPNERAFWADIAERSGRSAVVAAIAQSSEASLRRLNVYYRTFLLRDVDPAGRATFLPLMTGRGDFVIPEALGGSPEYWQRAQTRTF